MAQAKPACSASLTSSSRSRGETCSCEAWYPIRLMGDQYPIKVTNSLSNNGLGKQQVDEPLGGRLRFVVGKAGPLVGFDDHVFRTGRIRHQEVEPDDRDAERPCRCYGRLCKFRMQRRRHIVQSSAGVKIGRLAHEKPFPFRPNVAQTVTMTAYAPLGFGIDWDTALASGRGGTPPALGLDQLGDRVLTGAG